MYRDLQIVKIALGKTPDEENLKDGTLKHMITPTVVHFVA